LEDEAAKLTMAKLHEFCHKVEKELHLDGVWDLKPLINGQDLMKLLGLPPGPAIRILLEWFTLSPTYARTQQVITTAHSHTTHYTTHHTRASREMAWQLTHPHGTLEECTAYLRQVHAAQQI
jgi:hypothetical protein